jgi:hypothetical protein
MSKQEAASRRDITAADLEVIDRAIADHEKLQVNLYTLRRILGEVGKVDAKRADLNRGVEAEQQQLDDLRKQSAAAHNVQVRAVTENLANIRAEIQKVKNHFGV